QQLIAPGRRSVLHSAPPGDPSANPATRHNKPRSAPLVAEFGIGEPSVEIARAANDRVELIHSPKQFVIGQITRHLLTFK
ncbi:MAG TPA: hypothetical protein VGC05_23645, partial [Mycobacterium sp.]